MKYVFCNSCGHRNPPASSFCSACGSVLDQSSEHTVTILKGDPLQDAPGPQDNESVVLGEIGRGNAALIIRSGPRSGERFILRGESATIGRTDEHHICLDDVTVSRSHAEIRWEGGSYRAVDLGSLNGTYLNQRRIEAETIRHGDELQVGRFRMVFFEGR
ncbi:MAG: FHA domain-containing protein [Acidobacteria bacterium]|nr:FHA domain-containing protein [Acidobacteriota bacterium]